MISSDQHSREIKKNKKKEYKIKKKEYKIERKKIRVKGKKDRDCWLNITWMMNRNGKI